MMVEEKKEVLEEVVPVTKQIELKVIEVKTKYDELNTLQDSIKEKTTEFEKSIEEDKQKLANLKKEIETIETSISTIGKLYFQETQEKNLFGGYKIQERKVIEYDNDKALTWAKEKDMFLTLDKKAFDKAIEGLNLDFVTIKKEPSLTIPKIIKI
jgi:hypothetical protein